MKQEEIELKKDSRQVAEFLNKVQKRIFVFPSEKLN